MADVARGSVLLTPKFDNLMSNVTSQLESAFGKASSTGSKAGGEAGEKYNTGFSGKTAALMGIVSSLTSKAFDAISSSLGSAISRVDTMNNFPKVMSNLGYSAGEAEASIKKMSASIDGLPTSLPALTGMVQQLAPLCSSLDEATDIGIAFNDMCLASGASTADVSRAMQQYSQILSKGKPDLQDWKTLQEVMPGQLNQVAQALLGPTANSKDLYSALKDGTVSMTDFNSAIMDLDKNGVDGFASFAQQAKDATQGIGTALDNVPNRIAKALQTVIDAIGATNISGAINAFTGSFSGIGNAIATVINGAKTVIGAAVTGIASVLTRIGSALPTGFLDGIASAFKAIAPAVAPAVAAFALLLPVMGGLSKAVSVARGIGSLGKVLSTLAGGPIGLAVIAIAALVAGFAALYNSNETVRNAVDSAWQQIQATAAAVWPYVQQAVTTACSVVQSIVQTVWPYVQSAVTTVMGAVQSAVEVAWPVVQQAFATACSVVQSIVQAAWPLIESVVTTVMGAIELFVTTVWPTIQNVFLTACAAIQAIVAAVWPVIQSVVTTVMTVISAVIQTVWPVIQAIFTTACAAISTVINAVWPVIQTVITTVMNVINAVIGTVLAAIDGNWSGVWQGIKAIASTVWTGIQSVVSVAINAVKSIISSALGTIRSVWDSCWNGIKGAFKSIWNGIKSGAKGGIDAVYNTVTGIKGKITGFFSGAGSWLVASGKALLNGLKRGIEGAVGSVTSAVSGALSKIRGLFPFSPAKWGPFSGHGYTTYSGAALMGDFGKAIAKGAVSVASLAEHSMEGVRSAFDTEPIAFTATADARALSARAQASPALAVAGAGGATYVLNYNGDQTGMSERMKMMLETIFDEMDATSRMR